MGGRGRGGGAGTTMRAVANALGIARHEISSYQQPNRIEPPPLYPSLSRTLIPIEIDDERAFLAEGKNEMVTIFQESEYHIDKKEKRDVRRYTDKYSRQHGRDKLKPDFSRVPQELCWIRDVEGAGPKKKRKTDDVTVEGMQERLRKLEEKEREGGEGEEDNEDEEEGSEKSEQVEAEALSEEDYAEEDNDYISNYFDNGEGYGDAGSDENMDGDEF